MGVEAFPGAFSVLSGGVGRVNEKSRRLLWSILLNDRNAVALNERNLVAEPLDVPDAFGERFGVPTGFDAFSNSLLIVDSHSSGRSRGLQAPE